MKKHTGVAYQLTPDDPLTNDTQCGLDARLMKELGANSIRVYLVDWRRHHDACMQAFQDAGIRVFLDLSNHSTSMNQLQPQWNDTMLRSYANTMDEFQRYPNLAGFFIGNKVITQGERVLFSGLSRWAC